MATKALLILEDGTVFTGRAFGATARAEGEVVLSLLRDKSRSFPKAEGFNPQGCPYFLDDH